MQELLRRRPLEKRHSKPCKYYQTMSCPLSADACDFAHVLVNPASRLGVDDTCRHYQSGYCANGSMCRYAHTVEAPPPFSEVAKVPSTEQQFPGIYMNTPSVINNGIPNLDLPATFSNLSISSGTSPPINKHPLFLNASYPMLPSPSTYPDLDDFAVCTEDPQMSEHSHTHQSRVYITDAISPVHASPFSTSPPFQHSSFNSLNPHFKTESSMLMVEPNVTSVPVPVKKRRSRGVSKKKLAKYKTKPCKFFFGHGMCPNGDKCAFIHSEDAETLRRIHLNWSAGRRNDTFGEPGYDQSGKQDAGDMPLWTSTERDLEDDLASLACSSESQTPLLSPQLEVDAHHVMMMTHGPGGRNIKGRARANSIPSTPSASSQMGMEYLFPAESPAIL